MRKNTYIRAGYRNLLKVGAVVSLALTLNASAESNLSDDELAEAVKVSLNDFPPTASIDPQVSVDEGILTLKGDVDSLVVKNLASETSTTVRGVRAIVNDLQVKETSMSDSDIADSLDRLFILQYHHENGSIDFRVNDGVVTLTGTAPTFAVRRLAENMASSVIGVRSVVNLVRIIPFGDKTDDDIRQQLGLVFQSDPWVETELVKVSVDEGVVELHGAVDSYAEKSRLVSLAELPGVVEIEAEKLEVSPELRPETERPHKPMFRSDEELQSALSDAYSQDGRVEKSNISIQVQDESVYLTGSVNSIGAKAAAEQIANDLPGADTVFSFLIVDYDKELSDQEMAQKLNSSFSSDSILDGSSIEAKVADKVVTLTGMVDTKFQRRHAVKMASNTLGVEMVISKLRIDWDSDTETDDSSVTAAQ